jgi:hypothetical protein
MLKKKKKNSVLNIERPTKDKPSTLALAEQSSQNKKAGRKPMPIEEKGTEPITLKITKKQKEYIEKQAGLIPIATFLKAKLKESGVL